MDSLISLEFKDENKLIDFLKSSYSMVELYGICRSLNLDKDDILVKYLPPKENCANLIDAVRQNNLYSELFSILQSPSFHRKKFSEEFPQFYSIVPSNTAIDHIRTTAFKAEKVSVDYAQWIATAKEKMVLVLGKDSTDENMEELKNICEILRGLGYSPILIKDQPEITTLSNEEKMLAYASISRFVLIEKSYPAGQIDEAKICAFNRVPSIWLQKSGMGDTWMQGDYEVDFKFINCFAYNEENTEAVVNSAVEWIEGFLESKREFLDMKYPWRN